MNQLKNSRTVSPDIYCEIDFMLIVKATGLLCDPMLPVVS